MAGPSTKISAHSIEVIEGSSARAKIGHDAIEVVKSFTVPTTILSNAASGSVGSAGDECNGGSIDAAWTLTGISGSSADGAKYVLPMDSQSDRIMRSFTDPTGALDLVAHLTGLATYGGVLGVVALDGAGAGKSFSPHNDGNSYLWNIATYQYSTTGPAVSGTPTVGDHWVHLQRDASNNWRGRYSSDGTVWSSWTTTAADSRTITQIGVLRAFTGGSNTVNLERFVAPSLDTASSANLSVSQGVVEVLSRLTGGGQVSQHCIEVLVSGDGYAPSTSGGQRSSVAFG
jgi:hypothetical protein